MPHVTIKRENAIRMIAKGICNASDFIWPEDSETQTNLGDFV